MKKLCTILTALLATKSIHCCHGKETVNLNQQRTITTLGTIKNSWLHHLSNNKSQNPMLSPLFTPEQIIEQKEMFKFKKMFHTAFDTSQNETFNAYKKARSYAVVLACGIELECTHPCDTTQRYWAFHQISTKKIKNLIEEQNWKTDETMFAFGNPEDQKYFAVSVTREKHQIIITIKSWLNQQQFYSMNIKEALQKKKYCNINRQPAWSLSFSDDRVLHNLERMTKGNKPYLENRPW